MSMPLSPVEREKISDSLLEIQAVRSTLGDIEKEKIPDAEKIEECLESADDSLQQALGHTKPAPDKPEQS